MLAVGCPVRPPSPVRAGGQLTVLYNEYTLTIQWQIQDLMKGGEGLEGRSYRRGPREGDNEYDA